ncbi:MAG: hypothetical protein KC619_21630 [Myxococcales bacterium]|nr:hypothetical protein [Myxococcales bacterium]
MEVTSSNLATEEARAKIGARSAEGHSAYILGDEIIVACDACGWTYDPMEGGDKISYSSAPAEQ